MKMKKPKLIVHGGAWNIPEDYVPAHLAGVRNAIETIYPKLEMGMSALDAVEQAVNILEEDPTFDSGRGAFLNEKGEIELDAMIMDGKSLNFGAVAAIQNFLNPVSIARKVMEETEHCMLVGEGAMAFAKKTGYEELPPEALLTERELEFYHKIKNDQNFETHMPFEFSAMDTVGAVAMDIHGNLAAATSTGGTARKMQGRVGDSPIPGSGAYADNYRGAASATGWGESIMRVGLCNTVCALFATKSAMEAAVESIEYLKWRVDGLGGIIGINKDGDYGFAHNTPKMAFGYVQADGEVLVRIKT